GAGSDDCEASWFPCAASCARSSRAACSSRQSFHDTQSSNRPPASSRPMTWSSCTVIDANRMRSTVAAAMPMTIARARCSLGNPATAIPMTTALSPASTRSTTMTCASADSSATEIQSMMLQRRNRGRKRGGKPISVPIVRSGRKTDLPEGGRSLHAARPIGHDRRLVCNQLKRLDMTTHCVRYSLSTAVSAVLGTVLCSAAVLPAHAQIPRPQLPPLEEIVVTATRLETTLDHVPAAVSVVSKDDIQLGRQQLALDESLSRVPGLFMQNRYNFAQDLRVSIRGFGARANFGIRGVKILVDGIPETLPDGQGSVDSIDLGATSQIEVIRGPSSTLYGNASGGVISLTSEPPPEEPFAELRVSGGRYDFQKLQFKAGGSGERVGYLLSVSDSKFDGFREQSRYENTQLSGRFNVDLDRDRQLLAVVNLTDQPVSDDPGGITAQMAAENPSAAWPANIAFRAGEALEQQRLGFVYSMPLGDGHKLSARNYYVWRDFSNSLPFVDGGIVDLDRFFVGGGLSYTYDGFWLDRPNRLVIAIDYDNQDDDRRRFDNNSGLQGALTFDQNESVRSRGIFLQNELSISEQLLLTMGIRFDEVVFDVTDRYLSDGDDSGRRTLDGTSPMVGLTYAFSPNLNLYATYSTAFETPTTTEFNDPSGGGGFNPTLDPQEASNIEF